VRIGGIREDIDWKRKALFGAANRVSRVKVPDILYLMRHRREMFGGPFSAYVHETLRGESDWTKGQRELFASLAAARRHCLF